MSEITTIVDYHADKVEIRDANWPYVSMTIEEWRELKRSIDDILAYKGLIMNPPICPDESIRALMLSRLNNETLIDVEQWRLFQSKVNDLIFEQQSDLFNNITD